MSEHHLCGSYFRPWSPGDQDDSRAFFTGHHLDRDSSVLDLSKKTMLCKKSQQASGLRGGMKPSTRDSPVSRCGGDTKQESGPYNSSNTNNSYQCLPNPYLLQQLQAYYNYHLIRNLPILQKPQGGLSDDIIKWQKRVALCGPSSPLSNRSPPINNHHPGGGHPGSLNIVDSVNDAPAFIQHRGGILNVPSPSFTHNPSAMITDETWESKYPLPSAKDGEPLDLLPKSLYMNKAHGGHLCIFCGKHYSRKYGLKIHLRTHTGYKPLKCKVCQRPFGDPSNLNKHIRLHAEGETPYRCEQCGKVLVRRRDLERHIRSRHPTEAEKMVHLIDLPISSSSSDDGLNSSFEAESLEELDVVGLQQ